MGCAHGIESSLLQESCLAIFRSVEGCSAHNAVVVVQAGSVQLQRLSVQQQSAIRGVFNGSDAIAHRKAIGTVGSGQLRFVEEGVGRRPEVGLADVDGTLNGRALPRGIHHLGRNHHRVHVGRAHGQAPVVDVGHGGGDEPHIAIDARTGIPPAVFLLRIVYAHHNLILAHAHERCCINPERRVAIGPTTSQMAVHIDLGIHVDALEIEAHAATAVFLSERQLLAIPAAPRGQIAAIVARRSLAVETLMRTPVVGQRHPLTASEVAVVQAELPVGVQQLATLGHTRGLCLQRKPRRAQQTQKHGQDDLRKSFHVIADFSYFINFFSGSNRDSEAPFSDNAE